MAFLPLVEALARKNRLFDRGLTTIRLVVLLGISRNNQARRSWGSTFMQRIAVLKALARAEAKRNGVPSCLPAPVIAHDRASTDEIGAQTWRDDVDQPRLKAMTTLTLAEKRLVGMLRAAGAGVLSDELPQVLRAALTEVAVKARAADLILLQPREGFVGPDELAILSRLILLQRPSRIRGCVLMTELQIALRVCAEALLEQGQRLPARTAMAHAHRDRDRGGSLRLEGAVAMTFTPSTTSATWKWNGRDEPPVGSLRARALALVRARETVSASEFIKVGISRQYLSELRKGGYVERVGHGRYRLPQFPTERRANAA